MVNCDYSHSNYHFPLSAGPVKGCKSQCWAYGPCTVCHSERRAFRCSTPKISQHVVTQGIPRHTKKSVWKSHGGKPFRRRSTEKNMVGFAPHLCLQEDISHFCIKSQSKVITSTIIASLINYHDIPMVKDCIHNKIRSHSHHHLYIYI